MSRVVVSLDGSNGQLKMLGYIPQFMVMDGSISAMDSHSGLIYVIMDNSLVSTTIKYGGITDAVRLDCEIGDDCPQSLGYYDS